MFIRARADRLQCRDRRNRRGFTLLEVMIATMILAMLVFALFRFVTTTLRALDATTQLSEERASVEALTRVVQTLLNDISPKTQGALLGKANKFHDLSSDEMTWLCRSGPGVMTTAAPGDYRVTLTVQPAQDNTSELELGLRRELVTADDKSDVDFFQRGTGSGKYNWLPLIRPIAALEIRYWDSRLNSQVQQWNDQGARPDYVHMRIWKNADDVPYDVVLPVPASRIDRTR